MGEQGTLTVWEVLAESGVCVEARLLWWLERELEDKTAPRVHHGPPYQGPLGRQAIHKLALSHTMGRPGWTPFIPHHLRQVFCG